MTDVVIASAVRTAIGSYGESLVGVPPSDMGAAAGWARASGRRMGESELVDPVIGDLTEPFGGQGRIS